MEKLRNLITILVIISIILFGCTRDLHNGRSYVVEEVKGTQNI